MNGININDINDFTRLYQLYMMMDKMLSIQKDSGSDIDYSTLKKFKELSIRINSLHSSKLSQIIQEYDYKTKDIYLEQERLSKLLQKVDEVYNIQKLLITKYSKYSLLPLSFETVFPRELYEIYKEKMENIDEYVKNEDYISKIEDDLNKLGISLGESVHYQSVRESKLLEYENDLLSYVLNNNDMINELKKHKYDILDFVKNEDNFIHVYDKVSSLYNDAYDKYEAMSLISNNKYDDVVNTILEEYNECKFNKLLLDIINLLIHKESQFEIILEKRRKIKKYIDDIGYDIFDVNFVKYINNQLQDILELEKINEEIGNIKKEINKNNTLLNRIKNRQKVLAENIEKLNEYKQNKKVLKNQVIDIKNSNIDYSSEKVKNVLNFVYNKIFGYDESLNKSKDDDIFVNQLDTNMNNSFGDSVFIDSNLNDNISLGIDNDIFVSLDNNNVTSNTADDVFIDVSDTSKLVTDDKDMFVSLDSNNNTSDINDDVFIEGNKDSLYRFNQKVDDNNNDMFVNDSNDVFEDKVEKSEFKTDNDIFINNNFDPVKNNSNIFNNNIYNEPFWPS